MGQKESPPSGSFCRQSAGSPQLLVAPVLAIQGPLLGVRARASITRAIAASFPERSRAWLFHVSTSNFFSLAVTGPSRQADCSHFCSCSCRAQPALYHSYAAFRAAVGPSIPSLLNQRLGLCSSPRAVNFGCEVMSFVSLEDIAHFSEDPPSWSSSIQLLEARVSSGALLLYC